MYTGWSKKSLWINLEEKCLRNYKIFFDKVFLSISSKLVLSKLYVEKKCWGSKNHENSLFKKSHPIKKEKYLFCSFSKLLQDNSYSCLKPQIDWLSNVK